MQSRSVQPLLKAVQRRGSVRRGEQGPFSGDEAGQHRNVEPTIAWRYAPDAWAVVRGTFDETAGSSEAVPSGLRQIASAVEIGEPAPVRLPFRVGFRPPGLTPVNVLTYEAAGLRRTVEYDYADARHDWRDPLPPPVPPATHRDGTRRSEALESGHDGRWPSGHAQRP